VDLFDPRPQLVFVSRERHGIVAGQLAGQDVGADDGEGGAVPGQR
jgi:hypothetical protein